MRTPAAPSTPARDTRDPAVKHRILAALGNARDDETIILNAGDISCLAQAMGWAPTGGTEPTLNGYTR